MKTLARPADKAEILERIGRLRPGHAGRWGRMSVRRMVCHVSDAYRMMAGEKRVRGTGGLLGRTVVKWMALYFPAPWPPGVRTSPEIDQEIGGTRPGEWTADLRDLVALVGGVTSGGRAAPRQPHPLFGPMSEAEWQRWAYRHADHHLRQFGA